MIRRMLIVAMLYALMGCSIGVVESDLVPCDTDIDCMVKNPHIDY